MGKLTDKIIDKYADKYGEKYIPDYLKEGSNSQWEQAFKGTDYEALYNSIISAYDSNHPTPTLWGVITGQNLTNNYLHTQERNNALLALAEKMYNENYESPVSDVQRQREAGLNPDLLGLSGQSADDMNPQATNPNIKAQSPLEVVHAVENSLQLAFTTAFSSWQSIKAQNMAFTKDQLDIDDKTFDLSRKMYKYGVKHDFDRNSTDHNVLTRSVAFDTSFGSNRFRKNYSKTVDNLITRFSNGANWFDYADSAESRNKFIKQRADYYKVPYNHHSTSEDMSNTFANIRALAIKTEEMKLALMFQQDNYNANKYANMDGSVSGRAQFQQDSFTRDMFYFKNKNIGHYQLSDWAENSAKRAIANYQHFYHNCMLNLLTNCGYVGFTAWTAFAKSNPIPAYISNKFSPPSDRGSFGFYY